MSMQRLLYGIQDPYSIPKSLYLANSINLKIGAPPRLTELVVRQSEMTTILKKRHIL